MGGINDELNYQITKLPNYQMTHALRLHLRSELSRRSRTAR